MLHGLGLSYVPEQEVVGHSRRNDDDGVQPSVVQRERDDEQRAKGEAIEEACCDRR